MRSVVALLVCLCFPFQAAAQAVLYVTSGNGNASRLYTVNPATAQSVLIGDVTSGAAQLTITGMAVQPGTGVLFGVTGNETGPGRQLVTINPLTAQAVIIGSLGTGSSDISFAADGTLFSWTTRGGPMGTINLATGTQTPVGTGVNGNQSNGLTFTPGGALYLAGPSNPGSLFTVNPTTGAITSVAALTNVPVNFGGINAMASDGSGQLFVVGRGNSGLLATINVTTGAMTSVGIMSFGEADALAFSIAIPEPSTWTLLVLGLVGGGLAAWRRRKH